MATIEPGFSLKESASLTSLRLASVSDDPTEELACWGATLYAYPSIAHMRTVLAGLITLTDSGNTPTANIVSRHVFEWTAHACYMQEKLTEFMAAAEWKLAFELNLQADTGNQWVKKHGRKYDKSNYPDEALSPIRIKHIIAAYTNLQGLTLCYRVRTGHGPLGNSGT
jgi:hypothetical protein